MPTISRKSLLDVPPWNRFHVLHHVYDDIIVFQSTIRSEVYYHNRHDIFVCFCSAINLSPMALFNVIRLLQLKFLCIINQIRFLHLKVLCQHSHYNKCERREYQNQVAKSQRDSDQRRTFYACLRMRT